MDDLTFEEAKQRFAPGDQFVITDAIKNFETHARPGDIVELVEVYLVNQNAQTWGIKFEYVSKADWPNRIDPRFDTKMIFYQYIEFLRNQPEGPKVCVCDIFFLMRAACSCGAFAREMAASLSKKG